MPTDGSKEKGLLGAEVKVSVRQEAPLVEMEEDDDEATLAEGETREKGLLVTGPLVPIIELVAGISL